MKKYDLDKLISKSEIVTEYLAAPSKGQDMFNERLAEYRLDSSVTEELKAYAGEAHVFVFSAEWCPDYYLNVPILKLINDVTGARAV